MMEYLEEKHDKTNQINYPIFKNPDQYLRLREGKGLFRFFKRFFEKRSLDICLKPITDIASVCDCPCGPGRLFGFWKKRRYKVIAVDLSNDMVKAAEKEFSRIKVVGDVFYHDAFTLAESEIERADLVACVRFIYYFDRSTRVQLLKSLRGYSKKYVLVQYKTAETLTGRKNRSGASKYFTKNDEIIEELMSAGIECLRIVPKGHSSDRVYVLGRKIDTKKKTAFSKLRPYIYNPIKLYAKIAAVFMIGSLLGIFTNEQVGDPHERFVEQVVQKYQDGDDTFYVSDNGYYEDIRVPARSSVILVKDLVGSVEGILSRQPGNDFYFLIPSADTRILEKNLYGFGLKIVKNIKVHNEFIAILTNEVHAPVRSLVH